MSEAEQIPEESQEPQSEAMSFEDKFLGVKHKVVKSVQEKLDERNKQEAPEMELEIVDERAPEDRKPPRTKEAKDLTMKSLRATVRKLRSASTS